MLQIKTVKAYLAYVYSENTATRHCEPPKLSSAMAASITGGIYILNLWGKVNTPLQSLVSFLLAANLCFARLRWMPFMSY